MTDSETLENQSPNGSPEGAPERPGEIELSPEEMVRRLLDERESLLTELDQAKDHALRTLAEMQNFRRRQQDEMSSVRKFATEQLVSQLIPVLDNFERTLAAAESGANLETLLDGVRLIDRQLRAALESVQLRRMEALGQQFNPDHHEAIAAEESEEAEEGTVLHEIQPGYLMADRVVRPAMVKVSRKS